MSFTELPEDVKLIVAHAAPFVSYRHVSHSSSHLLKYAPIAHMSELDLLNEFDPIEFSDEGTMQHCLCYNRTLEQLITSDSILRLEDDVISMLRPLTEFRRVSGEMEKRSPCFVTKLEGCKAAWKIIERTSSLIKCTHATIHPMENRGC